MKIRILLAAVVMVWLSGCLTPPLHAQASMDIETGLVSTGYNDIRIPGDGGTLISLKDDLKPSSGIFYRMKLNYTFGSAHTLSLLLAPLTVKSKGRIDQDVEFAGKTFLANSDLRGSYKFNSYRLTYRYDFVRNPGLECGLGFTAKIRDARIALSSQGVFGEKSNVGFVPIINFRLFWRSHEKLGFLLEGDALAAPQGRAIDVLCAASYDLSDRLGIKAGYRILEGGADNDEVYTFSLFHYVAVGVSYTF